MTFFIYRQVTVPGLKPNTEYFISIITFVGELQSQEQSEPTTVTITTDDFAPAEILIVKVQETFVTFQWGETRYQSATGYQLSVAFPNTNAPLQVTNVTLRTTLQHTFFNLQPGTRYVLYVEVTGIGGLESRSRPFRTSEFETLPMLSALIYDFSFVGKP